MVTEIRRGVVNATEFGSIDVTGAIDCSAVLQSGIDYLFSAYAGGKLMISAGNLKCGNLIGRGGVILKGVCREVTTLQGGGADRGIITLDATIRYGGLRDLMIVGFMHAAGGTNAVTIAENVPAMIRDCTIWGGSSAIYTKGCDGTIENCFISGWGNGALTSQGSNWYKRCKFDTSGQHCSWGFLQGSPVSETVGENYFEQCDFSGDYDQSIQINDGVGSSVTKFNECITSSPINLNQHKHTSFTGHTFGSSVLYNPGPGTLAISGSIGLVPIAIPGGVKTNIGIA